MFKNDNFKLLIILILLFSISFIFSSNLASAPWWNSSWSKKQAINVSVASGYTGTNYQVKLNITYDSDMQADFDDLRFTNGSENTALDYWLETKVDSTWALVWVEVDQNITTANYTFYMYYGNPTATSSSNGTNTFNFFDDFSSDTTANYVKVASKSQGSTTATMTYDSTNKLVNITRSGVGQTLFYYPNTLGYNKSYAIEAKVKLTDGSTNEQGGLAIRGTNFDWWARLGNYNNGYEDMYRGNSTNIYVLTTNAWDDNTDWHVVSMMTNTTSIIKAIDYVITNSTTTLPEDGNISIFSSYSTSSKIQVDEFKVRKYANALPITYLGSEQNETIAPTFTWTSPTPNNASNQSYNFVYLNTTVTDTNPGAAFYDWDRTLIGYWGFNEGSGTIAYDNSSWGNNGTLTNGPLYSSNGKFGKAITFDNSDDYISAGNDSSLHLTSSNLTLEAWVYPTDNGKGLIVGKTVDGSSSSSSYFIEQEATTMYPFIEIVKSDIIYCIAKSNVGLTQDNWNYVVGTFDINTANLSIYVNGILTNWTNVSTTGDRCIGIKTTNTNVTIGRYAGGYPASAFSGNIDEVKIYSRVLSSQEINASYNNGLYRLENNFTNLSVGTYQYNAYAIDTFGNLNKTQTRQVSIDTTAPVAEQGTNPIAFYNSSSTTVVFDAKCSDNSGLSALQIWANDTGTWSAKTTQTSPTNNTWYNLSVASLTQAKFSWGVRCNDSAGNVGWSVNRTITVDSTPPVVTLNSPVDYYNSSSSSVTFSCTANEALSSLKNITLYGNWTSSTIETYTTPERVDSACGESPPYTVDLSIDRDTNTYWGHDADEQHWIVYQMPSSDLMKALKIYTDPTAKEQVCGVSEVDISDDPGNMGHSLGSGDFSLGSPGEDWYELAFTPATGQYIKIVLRISDGEGGCRDSMPLKAMFEFQADVVTTTTGWASNGTNSSPINNTPTTFARTLSDGNYLWNCQACDYLGNCAFATANRTLIVETGSTVTFCRNLTSASTTYTLQNNVSSEGTCFNIQANDITLNCNNHKITYADRSIGNAVYSSYNKSIIKNCIMNQNSAVIQAPSIYLSNSYNSTIFNNNITTSTMRSDGIYVSTGSSTNISNNNISCTASLWVYGIYLESSSYNNMTNDRVYTTGESADSVYISTSSSSIINNCSFNTNNSASYALHTTSSDAKIQDTYINSSYSSISDIQLEGSGTINLTNCTFTKGETAITDNGMINVFWYADVFANSSDYPSGLSSVNVTVLDINNNLKFTELTDANGNIARKTLREYQQNNTGYYYDTNYTFTGNKTNYDVITKYINLTTNYIDSSKIILTLNKTFSVTMNLSTNLSQGIHWDIDTIPSINQSATGNNGSGITTFSVNVSSINGNSSLWIKADGDLIKSGGGTINLINEKFSYNSTNSSVPSNTKTSLTTDYQLVQANLTSGSYVYFKFYLNVSAGVQAGDYQNTVSFKVNQTT